MEKSSTSPGLISEIWSIVLHAKQVWKLIARKHKIALVIAGFLMAFTSACNIAIPLLLGNLVDDVKTGLDKSQAPDVIYKMAVYFLVMIGVSYLLREGLQIARRYLVENSCTRIDRDMFVRVVGRLLKIDLSHLTHEKIGALHGRIHRSVDGFVRFLRLGFLTFFPALLTGFFALAASVRKEPLLGLVMVGVIPTSIMLTLWQLTTQRGVRLRLMRSCEEMDGIVVEQLGGIDYVRAADTAEHEIRRIARAAEARRAQEIRHHFEMSLFGCAKALTEGTFHLIVIALAIYLAVHGSISLGDILTFSILFMNVMTPLAEIHRVVDEGHESSLQVADLMTMLNEPLDRTFQTVTKAEPRIEDGTPLISVDNLRVCYTTFDGSLREALRGVSLSIRHGEVIGVAGRSGCGKTTWLKVLLRLIHPTEGECKLGGIPLESLSRRSVSSMIGYVGQSPFVFAGSIAENIAYGSGTISPEELERAARMANIHDEIMAMNGGYGAQVAERGGNLSGGQKQRLALARIFLKNPPVLILDEATSALDNISERHVQHALAAARADRTVILVAHRLSTLRDADRILVFNDGQIVEVGNYDELVERDGTFAELVRSAEEDGMSVRVQPTTDESKPNEEPETPKDGVPAISVRSEKPTAEEPETPKDGVQTVLVTQ